MNLPIRFPKDEDVIVEEVARFRAMSPQGRMRSIRDLLAAGAWMASRSPKADFLRVYTREQEELTRQSIRDFCSRHG